MKYGSCIYPALVFALLTPSVIWADLAQGLDAAAKEDWPTAYREFKESALRGNTNAAVNLGNLYMRGLGAPQDYAQARAWYEKAALESNPIAEAKLGVIFYVGLGVEENRTRAAEWFQKAGDQGDAHSAMTLAEMYLAGDGVPTNRTEAYIWYTIASDLGYREAEEPRIKLATELPGAEINKALERVDVWRKSYDQQVEKAARLTAKRHPTSEPDETPLEETRHDVKPPVGASSKKKTPRNQKPGGLQGEKLPKG
ncbi:MAG: hypothetical protein RL333_440 [Pseudomonadota bacterium]